MSISDLVKLAVQRDNPIPTGLSRAGNDTSRPRADGTRLGDALIPRSKDTFSLWANDPIGADRGYSDWKKAVAAAGKLSAGDKPAVAVFNFIDDTSDKSRYWLQQVATVNNNQTTWPKAVPYRFGAQGDNDIELDNNTPGLRAVIDGDIGSTTDAIKV